MKLASLKDGSRDGTLIIVSKNLQQAITVPQISRTLQQALEHWATLEPALQAIYARLNNGHNTGFPFNPQQLAAPLPRAYQWLDGSAYLPHVERVRKARGADMPPSFYTDPLMYQGGSDEFLGPCDPIRILSADWGTDFEAEVAVITDDVPMGVSAEAAKTHIRLLMLVNDISLRNLIPAELAKGFGFLHGKPASAFSPLAVTPDELGDAWDGGRIHLPLLTWLNDQQVGNPDAGQDMQFDFPTLISHAAKTRKLRAGTIIGGGTVSNADTDRGYSCIAEKRMLEIIATGQAYTPFLQPGDRVRIEMRDAQQQAIFGTIDQEVCLCQN